MQPDLDDVVLRHEARAEKRGHMPASSVRTIQEVRVVDLDIKFLSMVVLFIKAAIAAIPAAVILAIIGTVTSGVVFGVLAGLD